MSKNKLTPALALIALSMAFTPVVRAQVLTTSTLNGSITNEQNQTVKGAAVTITHEPTGTVYTTTSRTDGSYSLSGLRPGGPYKISVQSEGNPPTVLSDVYLEIDHGADVNVRLVPAGVTVMDKFNVSASAIDNLFDASQTGSGSYLTNKDITDTPAGDRSINAIARLDPRVIFNRDPSDRAISVGGISNRYNMIQVDGVSASDPFGLNSNNTAAERNVIPLDSLEALSVSTSPYYARNGGFVGAQVNAITKSGTNQYHGSVYYTFRGRSLPLFGENIQMVGENLDDVTYPISKFDEQTIGVTIGGPILKNKLFFYVAYEEVNEDRVAPKPTTALPDATVQQIADKAKALGFEPGSATPPSGNKLNDKNLITKLDWQINSAHRATLRYNRSKSSRPTYPLFGDGVSQNNFSFDSDWYNQQIKSQAIIGQLISRWNEKLNTEFSYSHSKYHSEPKTATRQPYVEIRNIPVPGSSNTAYVALGTEYSRHLNVLDTKTDASELFASYQLTDKHLLQTGFQYENVDSYNAYVQYSLGYYRYNSLEDFLNKASTGGATGQYYYNAPGADAAANFNDGNLGYFINDKWRVTSNLNIDIGARIDMALVPDEVPYNDLFNQVFHYRNDSTYNGRKILSPRFGFNYQLPGDKKTVIRGGAGLFYGRSPRVWVGNAYSNTGMNYTAYQTTSMPAIVADPTKQPTNIATNATQQVAFIDPNFQLPSRWKMNLAVERELGFWDLKASVEAEKSIVRKDVFVTNLNVQPTAIGPDGREMYFSSSTLSKPALISDKGVVSGGASGTQVVDSRFTNRIIKLGNTGKGESTMLTVAIERPRKKDGWFWKAAYTNTDAEEAFYATSSVAASNWQNRAVFNANAQELHRSDLEVRHRIIFNISKDFQFIKGNPTTVSLVYEGRSGLPYSMTYSGDANGDGTSGNDLLYVPKRNDYSLVRFATTTDEANFYKIVDLYRLQEGTRVEANDHRYPWVNTFDVGVKQKVKLPGWRHHLTLSADILNVGNLLNSRWGVIRGSNQFYVKRENVATVTYDGNAKQYVYSKVNADLSNGKFTPSRGRGEPAATRWSVLLSARYEF